MNFVTTRQSLSKLSFALAAPKLTDFLWGCVGRTGEGGDMHKKRGPW